MPVLLPADPVEFHALLRRRIRDQDAIDAHHAAAKIQRAGASAPAPDGSKSVHTVGQTGCFCLDCLLHRKQEWRIGDVNTTIAGPRDHWKQYTWGDASRHALGAVSAAAAAVEPVVTPAVREKVIVHDAKQRKLCIERDAKFTAVASGKYHTLLLSESGGVFACGDNSYGALGVDTRLVHDRSTVQRVELPVTAGRVEMIAASAYASFALVVLPQSNAKQNQRADEARVDRRPGMLRRKSIEDVLGHLKQEDAVVYNHCTCTLSMMLNSVVNRQYVSVVTWGRGERGGLGLGGCTSTFSPTTINVFNSMRVLQISAGMQHVLVLTERDGVFAFGNGGDGRLGVGDCDDRLSPCRVSSLEGLHVVQVGAGDSHSVAVTGETTATRQVYSWGSGANGRLGHGDDQSRMKPTRISHFRGRKVIKISVGGEHNLAMSEMPDGVCVWSWGAGTYGQLGHRETWDTWVPRSVDEIRREGIRLIEAGQRHSLAISETRQLWVWGRGTHGRSDVEAPCPSTTCIVQPVKVDLSGIQLIAAAAGRDRTFVWGDRAIDKSVVSRTFGGSVASKVCVALPEFESLTSDCFRIVYKCGGCHLDDVCIACAHRCHVAHCLELTWTLENTLSRDCACFSSGKCLFDIERGLDDLADE